MKKILLIIFYVSGTLGCIFWYHSSPGWEPIVAFLGLITSLIILLVKENTVSYIKNSLNTDITKKTLTGLIRKTQRLDYKLLRKVRKQSNYKVFLTSIIQLYIELVKRISKNLDIEITSTLDLLNDESFNPIISDDVDFKAILSSNLEEITFSTFYNKTIHIKNPKLLWDCSCGLRKKEVRRCAIHGQFKKYTEATRFTKTFSRGLVKIEYGGIKILWCDHKNLWPPAIDSFHLIEDLNANGYASRNIKTVIDIGAGTGFLGIWLAKKNLNITDVHFTDWLLLPLFFSYYNSKLNNLNCSKRYMLGLNTTWINKPLENNFKYDLVICNPPYLPDLGFKRLSAQSTVCGTELLTNLIKTGLSIGNEVIISFSDIALPEANEAAVGLGINLENCKIGKPHCVPFRIPIAFNQKGYMKKLQAERQLKHFPESEYKFWHYINTYKIK